MSESRLEKSPLSHAKGASSSLQYPVRRMRNTAVLVKWIEEHQSNPYPTKAEKQYLAYYSGMNLTQLSTWFANARRRIKKIGMKTWLEGRSTFTVDLFPSPTLQPTRPMTGDSCTYGYAAASPYTAGLTGSYAYSTLSYPTQHPSAAIGLQAAQRVQNGPTNVYASDTSSLYQTSISSGSTMNGLYGTTQQRMSQPLIGMPAFNWPTMPAATPLSLTTTSTGNLQQSRPSSNTGPLHSPLTAYSADTLRTHSGQSTLDVAADGSTYSLQQPSPAEQMLPECASTEPILQGSPKTHYAAQASVTD